jgi:hypothetical protein
VRGDVGQMMDSKQSPSDFLSEASEV